MLSCDPCGLSACRSRYTRKPLVSSLHPLTCVNQKGGAQLVIVDMAMISSVIELRDVSLAVAKLAGNWLDLVKWLT